MYIKIHYNLTYGIHFQTVNMAEEVRKPVYWSVSAQAVNYDQVQGQMASVRWDIKDIMSQHNPYVDSILRVSPVFMTTQIDSILFRQNGQRTGVYSPHDHVLQRRQNI